MISHEEYIDQKIQFAYKLYKQNRFFRKSRAIVKQGDDFLVLYNTATNRYSIAGGGVEEGENIKKACIREAYEELGARVKIVKFLTKNYYSTKLKMGEEEFDSKRVEFFFLCEVKKLEDVELGIEGEFTGKIEVKKLSKEEFLKCKVLDKRTLNKIVNDI